MDKKLSKFIDNLVFYLYTLYFLMDQLFCLNKTYISYFRVDFIIEQSWLYNFLP